MILITSTVKRLSAFLGKCDVRIIFLGLRMSIMRPTLNEPNCRDAKLNYKREAINYERVYEPGWDGSIARSSRTVI